MMLIHRVPHMDNINEGLLFQGKLPVSLQLIDALPDEDHLAIINHENENFLKISLIIDEAAEIDEHDEIRVELRRQDLKINLLMDMVGELLSQRKGVPKFVPVKFTPSGIELQTLGEYKTGDKLEVEIYITPAMPRALKFYGDAVLNEDGNTIFIRFSGISLQVQDWLEKVIFRYHRRAIAHSHEQE